MTPGSANFAGMNEAQRNAIVQALLAQQGTSAPDAPFLTPYQDIVDPSDPASYDSTLGDIVGGFPSQPGYNPSPNIDNNIADPTGRGLTNDYNAISPGRLTEAQPDTIDDQGTIVAPAPNDLVAQTFSQITPAPPTINDMIDDAFDQLGPPTAPDESGGYGGLSQGAAIAADVAGSLSAVNAAVNDAVAGYAVDQGFNADPGGFTSDPGGFSAPGGFGDGVGIGIGIGAGLGAGLGEGAGISGGFGGVSAEAGGSSTGVSSGPGGTGEGGAGGGGDGGAGK